jgi:outer membrane protein OmpA-like peptidoglycan-associated protein
MEHQRTLLPFFCNANTKQTTSVLQRSKCAIMTVRILSLLLLSLLCLTHCSTPENQSLAFLDNSENPIDDAHNVYQTILTLHQRNTQSLTVSQKNQQTLYALAQTLNQNPSQQIRIIGHTSNEGSREYNLALGWQQAQLIATTLNHYTDHPLNLSVVSYGQERPIMQGTSSLANHNNARINIDLSKDHHD